MKALKVFWQAIQDLYEDLMLLAGVSVLWWLAVLLIVPGPPATAGLYYLAYRIVHEQRVEFSFFWEEFRRHFGKSWQLAGVNLLALVIMGVNFQFYLHMDNVLRYAAILWIYLFLLWLAMQIYLFPLLFEMEEPRLWWILRNALMLSVVRPGYTLVLLILLLAATLLSSVLFLLVIVAWPALVALVSARSLMSQIADIEASRAEPPAQES